MNNQNTLEILKALVEAIDNSYWSSWQTTARFDDQLMEARKYLDEHHEEYVNEYTN